MDVCEVCGTAVPIDARCCPKCGRPLGVVDENLAATRTDIPSYSDHGSILGVRNSPAARMIKALDFKDNDTASHSERVAEISCALAVRMGFSGDRLPEVRRGGLLHDIGKAAVPDSILYQDPTKLSAEESAILERHVQLGSEVVGTIAGLQIVAQIVLQHHEHWDGSGYPAGLTGEDIIPEARIMAVAEAVVEMSVPLPYSPGLGLDEVAARLKAGRGTLYDPAVVDAFLALASQYNS